MKLLLIRLVVCSMFLTSVGCGGGGGGGGEENGDVPVDEVVAPEIFGPYHYFEFVTGTTAFRFTEVGPAQVDTTGLLTGDGRRYFNFLASAEALAPTRVEIESPDGTLFNRQEDGDLLRIGGLGGANHLALLAAGDNFPNMVVLCRPAPGLDDGDLAGAYHFTLFSPSDGGSVWGQVSLDGGGAGSLPFQAEENVAGTIGTSEVNSLSYGVQPDGGAVLGVSPRSGPDLAFEGCVSDGGRLILASRTDSDGVGKPFVFAAVRGAQNADVRLLSGRYWIVVYLAGNDDGTMTLATLNGVLEADGAGGCVLDASLNVGGSFQTLENELGSYTVGRDGALRIDFVELAMIGGIAPGGRHAVLGGSPEERFPAQIAFLTRQP